MPETDYQVTVPGLKVCKDKDGEYCSCYMTCVDCGDANKNKYYVAQALTDGKGSYYFHFRFGRVGYTTEANNKCEPCTNLDEAVSNYHKTKKAKTAKAKGYQVVEMSLGKPKDDCCKETSSKVQKTAEAVAKSKLHAKVYSLMNFITDKELMNKAVENAGFDVKKLPLGNLSLQNLDKANLILKDIEDEIKKTKKNENQLQKLSQDFYTLIPHNFGFAKMSNFIIRDEKVLKQKADLVDDLIGIQKAVVGIKTRTGALKKDVKKDLKPNPVDGVYDSLNAELKHLPETSDEHKMLSEYLHNSSRGQKLKILDIFSLKRNGEDKKFNPNKLGNRKLLFHGSPFSNFVGIITNGMRIPFFATAFGKGVYFADEAAKSVGYCGTYNSGGVGLFVMGEIALGR